MALGKSGRLAVAGLILLGALAISLAQSHAQGGSIRFGESVEGTLDAGRLDEWLFTGTVGDIIGLSITRTAGNLEPTLLLQDPAGQPVTGAQAVEGGAVLTQVRLPQTGSYLIQVSAQRRTAGTYRLTLALEAAAVLTPTPEPTVVREVTAGTIAYGEVKQGEITDDIYRQLWRFSGNAGNVVDIRMTAISGSLDPFLLLVSPIGDVLASNDTATGGLDAGLLAYSLPFTGDYTIVARRAGADGGRGGSTTGRYELSVSLRGSSDATQNTILPLGGVLLGRLNESFPQAVYRLELGGAVVINLDLGGANRLARLRLLTTTGTVLTEMQGLSPLAVPYQLPGSGPYLVEVSAPNYSDQPAVDFRLAVYRRSMGSAATQALGYGSPRRSLIDGPDRWFFVAEAGDIVLLEVTPETPSLDTVVRVLGPQNTALYQGDLGPGLRQPLTLSAAGLYEIEVRSSATGTPIPYRIGLERLGTAGIPFGWLARSNDLGPLALGEPTSGALVPGRLDTYWLDAAAGQVIGLQAAPVLSNAVLGLALQRPDGSLLDVQFSNREQSAVIARALLDQPGRYRVVVFDGQQPANEPDGAEPRELPYRLRYEDASGGVLQAGQPVKGIVSPSNGLAVWAIDVEAGMLINARLVNLTPASWSPVLAVAEPGGQIIASLSSPAPAAGEQGAELSLLGVGASVTGKYQIIAAGQVQGNFASYRLLSDVQIPFESSGQRAVRVSAMRPPAPRYAPVPPPGPVQVPVAALVNPLLSPDQVPTAEVQRTSLGNTVRGEIPAGVLGQVWRVSIGSNVTFQARAMALSPGASPALALWNQRGQPVYEHSQTEGETTLMTYRVVQGGTYDLVVSMGLTGGRYVLTLDSLNVSDGPLQLATGKPLLYGDTVMGEILSADETDTYYFLGTAGDVVQVQLARTTGTLVPGLELVGPRGAVIAETPNAQDSPGTALLSDVLLRENGLYTLRIENRNRAGRTEGRYSLYLGLQSGLRLRNRGGGIITPGATRAGLLSVNDNQDTWLFQGHQGQRVTFTVFGLGDLAPIGLRLLDTAGRAFAAQESALSQNVARLPGVLLPADGIYRVQVVGGGRAAGIYTLTWEAGHDRLAAGPLGYGQTVSGLFTTQRQFDTWVFSGTAGDVVSVVLRYLHGDPFNGSFQLRAENGLPLATVADPGTGEGARADVLLPFSGSYSIVVANPDPAFEGAGVYALSISLHESKARSAGSVIRYGEQGTGDLYMDDPEDSWVFGARAGDRVRLVVRARDRFLKPLLELRTPVGELLASALPAPVDGSTLSEARIGGTLENDYIIPTDGVYVVTIRGAESDGVRTTGSYLLAIDFTPPPLAEIATLRYGDARPGLIADDRPEEFYVFSGQQGDTITAEMTREPGANLSPVLELRTDDDVLLARVDSSDGEQAILRAFKLPETGSYRLVAARFLGAEGQTAGRYTVRLEGAPEPRPVRGTIRYGQLAIGRLNDSTPVDRLTFEGKAGDVVGITTRATSGDLDIALSLATATGEVLAANDDADGTNAVISGALLPADGLYTIELTRVGTRTRGSAGNYEMIVNRLYQIGGSATPHRKIPLGARVVGTVDARQTEARYTFTGNQDDLVAVQLLHQTDDAPPLLAIQDPAGTTLAEGQLLVGRTLIERFRLPASGAYTILVRRPLNARAAYSPFALTLDLLAASTQAAGDGGILALNDAVVGTFVPGEAAHYWLFRASAGQVIAMNLLRLNGDLLPAAILVGPDGQGLSTLDLPEGNLSASVEALQLPAEGMYSILVLPGGANRAGQYRLTLQPEAVMPNVSTLTPGSASSGTVDGIGGGQRWVLEGWRGEMISARMLVTGGNLVPWLRLANAEGQVLAEGALERTAQGLSSVISSFVFPASGSYTLLADCAPDGLPTSGTYRLLVDLVSPGAPLSAQAVAAQQIAYGQPVRSIAQGGKTILWAFVGAAGDTVSISALVNNPASAADRPGGEPESAPEIEIQDESGRLLVRAGPSAVGQAETTVNSLVLPADGRYVIALRAPASVSYTLVVQRRQDLVPPDLVAARRLVPDTPLQNGITANDAVDYWSFDGAAGQVIQIDGRRLNGNLRLDLSLYGPSGYVASATAEADSDSVTFGPVVLPEDGSYLLVATRWLGAAGQTVGSYRLVMRLPDEASGITGGAIPAYGRAVTGRVAPENDANTWAFSGQAGELVEVRMTRLRGDLRPALAVFAPDGAGPLASAEAETATALISRLALPLTGQYTIQAGRVGGTSGSYRLIVERVQGPPQASIAEAEGIRYGEERSGELNQAAPRRAWVFFGRGGERVSIDAMATTESALDPYLYLLAPDGTILAADDNSGGGVNARLSSILLPADGFYGIVVSHSPLRADVGRSGAFTITVQRNQPGAVYQGQIRIGDEVGGTLTPDQMAQEWTFEVPAGQERLTIAASVSSPAVLFNAVLIIAAQEGRALAISKPAERGAVSVETTLPGAGRYAVLVSANAPGAQGEYRLRLGYALAPTGGGALVQDQRAYGAIDGDDFTDTWRFTLESEGRLALTATRLSGDLDLELALYGPDGSLIESVQAEGERTLTFAPPGDLAPGSYTVLVSRRGGPAGQTRGSYVLLVSAQPD